MGISKTNKPLLFGYDGPVNGEVWTIDGEVIIGRDSSCDIVIPDRQVSRKHASIKINSAGIFIVSDLGSKNGVFVNGDRIREEQKLSDGDAIKIALIQEFLFISSDATLPLDIQLPIEEENPPRLYLEENARRVWLGDEELLPPLSVQQYDLLTLLYKCENTVVARENIIKTVWGDEAYIGVSEQALDALIRRLRTRLHKKDPTHEFIITVRGVGFLFKNCYIQD